MHKYRQKFKDKILESDVLDSEDLHHEFNSGLHGRKLDFDKIITGSDLFNEWVDLNADYISDEVEKLPDMLLGVANGTNRLAVATAAKLGNNVMGLMSEKYLPKTVMLNNSTVDVISGFQPEYLMILEDVGTTGTTSAKLAKIALAAGARKVSVLNTWQRSETLSKLDEAGVDYDSIVKEILPSYEPDECKYCLNGVVLVSHSMSS